MKNISSKNAPSNSSTSAPTGSINHQQLELPSDIEGIHIIEKLIETICSTYKLSEDAYGNILVAVTEAVNNAIYHGNKSNPAKKVKVTHTLKDHHLCFIICDEGNGFDHYNLPDPTAPENIQKANGRGVFLMKQLADRL